jgi:hypothetical protein
MLRIVSDNDRVPRTHEFSKGFREGLRRIAGITVGERSRDEWIALLTIFRWVTKDLECKVKSLQPKLRIVEKSQ